MKALVIVSSIVLAIIGGIIAIFMVLEHVVATSPKPCSPTLTIPDQYLQLLGLPENFATSGNQDLVLQSTMGCNFRNPVSFFSYKTNYLLQVYKMDDSSSISLTSAVKESFENGQTSTYTPYDLNESTDMEYSYKASIPKKPQKIYLDLYGNNTRVLKKNDTLAYYHSECSYFSLQYDPNGPIDIYGQPQNSFTQIPLELMFLRHDNALYMFILSSKTAGTELAPNLLYDFYFKK